MLIPGTVLQSRYRIIRQIGGGGQALVYLAEDTNLGDLRAVKELTPEPHASPQERQAAYDQFQREARVLAKLNHPNLARVWDHFRVGDNAYLIMDYIEGQTLQEIVDQTSGFLPEAAVLRWGGQLCDVLDYLHRQQPPIIFRDLKPSNVMLDRSDTVKLIDFGIVRLFQPGKKTDTLKMGTMGYAPPEQYKGKGQTDARADIYSLGALLHQLLTKRDPTQHPPFSFDTAPPRSLNPAISPHVEAAITKALAYDRVHRFQSASEMKRALTGAVRAPTPTATIPPPAARRWIELRWPLLALVAVFIVVIWFMVGRGEPAPPPTPTVAPVVVLATNTATLTPTSTPVAVVVAPTLTSTSVPTSTPTAAPTRTPTPGVSAGVEVELNIVEYIWLRVLVDGDEVFTGSLEAGTTQTWRGRESVALRCGNAGSVEAAVNGESLGLLGERGQVVEIEWLAEGVTLMPAMPEVAATPTITPTAVLGEERLWEKDDSVMIHVPAGEFLMGSKEDDPDAYDNEHPQHTVYVSEFWIDKTEVTNAQYRKCVEAGTCRAPTTCDSLGGEPTYSDSSKADHPVVCVSWQDAKAYCEWAGKRLPTEAEWEKAARGTDGRKYPWGNNFDSSKVNFCDVNCEYDHKDSGADDGYRRTAPVGSYPEGASPYGALDMAGNVWEWCQDWYDADYYASSPQRDPQGPGSGTCRVVRGGSWGSRKWGVRAALRDGDVPGFRVNYHGSFRCVSQSP